MVDARGGAVTIGAMVTSEPGTDDPEIFGAVPSSAGAGRQPVIRTTAVSTVSEVAADRRDVNTLANVEDLFGACGWFHPDVMFRLPDGSGIA